MISYVESLKKTHTHNKNSDIQRTDCYQRHSRGGGGNKELNG